MTEYNKWHPIMIDHLTRENLVKLFEAKLLQRPLSEYESVVSTGSLATLSRGDRSPGAGAAGSIEFVGNGHGVGAHFARGAVTSGGCFLLGPDEKRIVHSRIRLYLVRSPAEAPVGIPCCSRTSANADPKSVIRQSHAWPRRNVRV